MNNPSPPELNRIWDVVIVGAGVAGATLALQCSRQGMSVLLVEKRTFPRQKVCGGCLSLSAVNSFERLGLINSVNSLVPQAIDKLEISFEKKKTSIAIPKVLAIQRGELDRILVESACRQGAVFLDTCTAYRTWTSNDHRSVVIKYRMETFVVRGKIVVIATGLAGVLENERELRSSVSNESRIGYGTVVASSRQTEENAVRMIIGEDGYVGIVRCGPQHINIAACINRPSVRPKSTFTAVVDLLGNSNTYVENLAGERWVGTPCLSHSLKTLSWERIFVIGDAAEYSEPFTGQGIGWALTASMTLMPYITSHLQLSPANQWEVWSNCYKNLLNRQQRFSRALSFFLHRPFLTKMSLRATRQMPGLTELLLENAFRIRTE